MKDRGEENRLFRIRNGLIKFDEVDGTSRGQIQDAYATEGRV